MCYWPVQFDDVTRCAGQLLLDRWRRALREAYGYKPSDPQRGGEESVAAGCAGEASATEYWHTYQDT
ncbi:unnamed protein product [Pieris macdunnoughi]|uniref:Uncharacterized protein n=1 Tax=Pieris macdunnoughi TaxID=345717 RepID=A0A821VK67_9NEOP|nr:unnamed protein product [Pieris macdunnoughi]